MQELLALLEETPCNWAITGAAWSEYALVLSLRVQVCPPAEPTSLQHWQIICREPAEHQLRLGRGVALQLQAEHPLLWQSDRSWYATFSGSAAHPEAVANALHQAHASLGGELPPLEAFLNSQVALEVLLAGPAGLLATGPAFLMEAYAAVLRDHGFHATAQRSAEAADADRDRVLLYMTEAGDTCTIVGPEFEAVRLHAPVPTFAAQATTAEQPVSARVEVWRIGSPHDGDLPEPTIPETLRDEAAALGLTLDVRSYQSHTFTSHLFRAWEAGVLPDIIATGNYLNIQLLDLDSTAAQLGESVHESLRGLDDFVIQLRGSPNYEGARRLALRAPTLPAGELREALGAADAAALEMRIAQAVQAYVARDVDVILHLADRERIGDSQMRTASISADTRETHIAAAARLPQLAFALSVVIFEGERSRGLQHVLTAWRPDAQGWRLLVISNDPITTGEFFAQVRSLVPHTQAIGQRPVPAQLRYPADEGHLIHPGSGYGPFEDFIWQPSASADVLAEVVEVDFSESGSRLFLYPRDGAAAQEQRLSAGQLWGQGRDRWRVWSISLDGSVAFSETRTFEH